METTSDKKRKRHKSLLSTLKAHIQQSRKSSGDAEVDVQLPPENVVVPLLPDDTVVESQVDSEDKENDSTNSAVSSSDTAEYWREKYYRLQQQHCKLEEEHGAVKEKYSLLKHRYLRSYQKIMQSQEQSLPVSVGNTISPSQDRVPAKQADSSATSKDNTHDAVDPSETTQVATQEATKTQVENPSKEIIADTGPSNHEDLHHAHTVVAGDEREDEHVFGPERVHPTTVGDNKEDYDDTNSEPASQDHTVGVTTVERSTMGANESARQELDEELTVLDESCTQIPVRQRIKVGSAIDKTRSSPASGCINDEYENANAEHETRITHLEKDNKEEENKSAQRVQAGDLSVLDESCTQVPVHRIEGVIIPLPVPSAVGGKKKSEPVLRERNMNHGASSTTVAPVSTPNSIPQQTKQGPGANPPSTVRRLPVNPYLKKPASAIPATNGHSMEQSSLFLLDESSETQLGHLGHVRQDPRRVTMDGPGQRTPSPNGPPRHPTSGWISNRPDRHFVRGRPRTCTVSRLLPSAPGLTSGTIDPQHSVANIRKNETKRADSDTGFAFHEVVRGKRAREHTLVAHDCPECAAFFAALGPAFATSTANSFCRHRARQRPAETPQDFWEMSFVDER